MELKELLKGIAKSFVTGGFIVLCLCHVLCLHHYAGAEEWEKKQWEKVADKGFGDTGNDYAWSMATFRGKLYVGTLNAMKGAQIWCSSSAEPDTWKRVYHSRPSSHSGIRCLYADGNQALYAGTYDSIGAQILRTTNGRIWVPVPGPVPLPLSPGQGDGRSFGRSGLGDPRNSSIRCIVRFGDYLYAGTGSQGSPVASDSQIDLTLKGRPSPFRPHQYGAQLYRSRSGLVWELVETEPSFRSTKVFDSKENTWVTNNISIGELEVFQSMLYAFTWTMDATFHIQDMAEAMSQEDFKPNFPDSAGAFEVWRSGDGIQWEKVVGKDDSYGNGMGFSLKDPDPDSMQNDSVTSTAVYHGNLYLGTQNPTGKTAVWKTAEGTGWEKVLDFYKLGELSDFYIWRMITFRDNLFIGTMNMGYIETPGVTGSQVWAYDDAVGTFSILDHQGFDGETIFMGDKKMPKNYGVRTFGILNDTLFAGTATMLSVPTSKPGQKRAMTIAGKDVGCEIWKLVPAGD